ncbi:MAG: phosphoribosylanthranilate isomerase [Proteobacteria bacterium]|nr:phosphoribosylanthranilate isomerase [Pseudomonadota bacterium]
MPIDVKICGLSSPDAVDAAVSEGAALTGFVFFPASPRNVSVDQAAALTARVPAHVRKVALSVDADDAFLASIVAGAGIDALQLHGGETAERVAAIRDRFGLPVIKAVPISSAADVTAARTYQDVADMLLFDAKPPKDATRPGGNAEAFDWTLLAGLVWKKPWLLAGGVNAGNLEAAARITGARLVDTSSGVEDAPGRKSVTKIKTFIRLAKSL